MPRLTCQPHATDTADSGHTLLATLIAMSLISIMTAVSITAYHHQREHALLTAAAHQLTSLVAEGIAHSRQVNVPLTVTDMQALAGGDHWQQGITLRVTTHSAPLLSHTWPEGITVVGPHHPLFIMPRAFDSALTATFTFCTPSGHSRQVIFNRAGAARYEDGFSHNCQRLAPRSSAMSTS